MKNLIHFFAMLAVPCLISVSCTNQDQAVTEPDTIENTIQSVSYFKDSVGYDQQLVLDFLTQWNNAIDEIGYPDAGYQLWVIQEDDSGIKYMVEGHWPSQTIYNEIHEHPLYQEVADNNEGVFDGLVSVEYHRFIKVQ
jgi:L-amino acid N-acyltransferase YncA